MHIVSNCQFWDLWGHGGLKTQTRLLESYGLCNLGTLLDDQADEQRQSPKSKGGEERRKEGPPTLSRQESHLEIRVRSGGEDRARNREQWEQHHHKCRKQIGSKPPEKIILPSIEQQIDWKIIPICRRHLSMMSKHFDISMRIHDGSLYCLCASGIQIDIWKIENYIYVTGDRF